MLAGSAMRSDAVVPGLLDAPNVAVSPADPSVSIFPGWTLNRLYYVPDPLEAADNLYIPR